MFQPVYQAVLLLFRVFCFARLGARPSVSLARHTVPYRAVHPRVTEWKTFHGEMNFTTSEWENRGWQGKKKRGRAAAFGCPGKL